MNKKLTQMRRYNKQCSIVQSKVEPDYHSQPQDYGITESIDLFQTATWSCSKFFVT